MVPAIFDPSSGPPNPMSDRPVPQPGILKIAPYVPGRSDVPAGVTLIKLSANESPLGASPKARDAYLGRNVRQGENAARPARW